jgi:hypothetical protein
MRGSRFVWLFLGLAVMAAADSAVAKDRYGTDRRGNFVGEGENFGRGWEVQRPRARQRPQRVVGTGRNFGGGYEVEGRRITGTGNRFGGGYEVQGGGRRIVGTGNNFGGGWERSPNGREWIGTGRNFGRRCPARPGSAFVPCS